MQYFKTLSYWSYERVKKKRGLGWRSCTADAGHTLGDLKNKTTPADHRHQDMFSYFNVLNDALTVRKVCGFVNLCVGIVVGGEGGFKVPLAWGLKMSRNTPDSIMTHRCEC